MRKVIGIGLIVMVLAMALPVVSADDSLVGIVYKAYTKAECLKTFSGATVTNDANGIRADNTAIPQTFWSAKGPLKSPWDETQTNCYCDEGYIMREDKQGCVPCKTLDVNAVYYTSSVATDQAVKNKEGLDVGCRCSATKGSDVFAGIIDGKCTYGEKITTDSGICNDNYANSIACPANADESLKFTPALQVQGREIECCCKEGDKKEGNKCIGEGGATDEGNELCKERAPESVECSKSQIPKPEGDFDEDKASAEELSKHELTFAGRRGMYKSTPTSLYCCCPSGTVWDDDKGKCVDENDECTKELFANSVETQMPNAGNIIINGNLYQGKKWDVAQLAKMEDKELNCACKKGFIPEDSDGDGDWDGCTKVAACSQIILGSVDSTSKSAGKGQIINDKKGNWNKELLNKVTTLGLNCYCPEGTNPYHSTKATGSENDVCSVNSPSCLDNQELAAFLKVAICQAKKNGGEATIKLSEKAKGPVFLYDTSTSGVSLKTDEWGLIADGAGAIGYGAARALGLRDIYYWAKDSRLLHGGKCEERLKDPKSFQDNVEYIKCLADFPCDQMPDIKTDFQPGSGVLEAGGAIYYGALAQVSDEGKIADISKSAEEMIKVIEQSLEDARGSMTAASDAAQSVMSAATTGSQIKGTTAEAQALQAQYIKIVDESTTTLKSQTRTADAAFNRISAKYTDLEKLLKSNNKLWDVKGNKWLVPEIEKLMETTLKTEIAAGKDGVSALKGIRTRITKASGQLTEIAKIKNRNILAGFVSFKGADIGREVEKAASTIDKVIVEMKVESNVAKIAEEAKVSKSVLMRIRGVNKVLGGLGEIKVFKWIGKGIGGAGKYVLGRAALAYSIVDFASATGTDLVSKDLLINPGYEVFKADVNAGWTIKSANVNAMAGMNTIYISLGGGLTKSWLTDGTLLDFSTTTTVIKPPPIDGLTYECSCNPSCDPSTHKLTGCQCWPVKNSITIETDKATATGVGGGIIS